MRGRIAIISDIHGNYDGMLAALADANANAVDDIVCLGDLVDGGPANDEVVRYIRDKGIPTVRGNHDVPDYLDVAFDTADYLEALPETLEFGDVLLTHISPRVSQNKISTEYEAWNVFDEFDYRLIFVGHAHIPMIFGERCVHSASATEHAFTSNQPFDLDPTDRYIICAGSIGYSRDSVKRIRYTIYDTVARTVEMLALWLRLTMRLISVTK